MATMKTMRQRHIYRALTGIEPRPADRPADHLQRILPMLVGGGVLGAAGATLEVTDAPSSTFLLFIILAGIFAAVLCQLWANFYMRRAGVVPAVARLLPTDVPVAERTIRRAGSTVVLEPFAVRPVDGSPDFRAACFIRSMDRKNPWTAVPGTLVMVDLLKSGMGITRPRTVTAEQRRMVQYPGSLPFNAPGLPIRQAPWVRETTQASLEWWLSLFVGAVVAASVVTVLYGV